jgi:hypothetical protein
MDGDFPPRRGVPLRPLFAQAQEWGKRKAAESPRWQADKWRRVAAVFHMEVVSDPDATMSHADGRDAA